MEWCRMYKLKIVACLLGCVGLCVAMPDTVRQSRRSPMSERDHKLTELLKSLNSFSSESRQPSTSEKNSSQSHINTSTPPPPTEGRARMLSSDDFKIPAPDEESIRSYQDFYRMLGTPEGMDHIRTHYGPNGLQQARAKFGGIKKGMEEVRLANAHYLKVRTRARCSVPVPQVVRVKDYYPDISKEYIPRCTVLHRCGDTTGCCDSDAFRCVERAVQEVSLPFYTLSVGKGGLSYTSENSIEQLLFQNHTSCRCQPVNDLPRMQNHLLDGDDPPPKSNCLECPVPFTSRVYRDGRCGCDCFDKQRPCLRIKRGRDSLSEIERRCVLANQCHIPDCEYGQYDYDTGYCPRRNDEDHHKPHHRRPNHLSTNHRWAFIERD